MAKKAAPAKPSETIQIISAEQFTKLVRAVKNADADINDAQGSKSALVRKAVEKQHLDKKAFSIFQTLARMSDRKLATTLAHLEHYLSVGGLDERAARQGDMVGREQELAEAKVVDIKANGNRKKRSEKKAAGEKFENQHAREAAGEFEPGVEGEAVH